MRTLGPIAEAARQLRSYGGVRICLRIEFTDAVRYFTSGWEPPDVPAAALWPRVTDWGDVTSTLGEALSFPEALGGPVTIADPDGALRDLWEDESFQRLSCDIYWAVWTPGQAQPSIAQCTSVLRGVLAPPERWQESDLTVQIGITGYALKRDNVIELRASREDYPYIDRDDDGRVIPIVYGHARNVPGIFITGGPVTQLAENLPKAGTSFRVVDAREFPTGPITIQIGSEEILGSFNGNLFTILTRPRVHVTSTTTDDPAAGERATAIDDTLIGDGDNVYVGYWFRPSVALSDGSVDRTENYVVMVAGNIPIPDIADQQQRMVLRFISDSGKIEFRSALNLETVIEYFTSGGNDGPFFVEGTECSIKSGVPYTIQSIIADHMTGARVKLWQSTVDYIVGRQHLDVNEVYAYGLPRPLMRWDLTKNTDLSTADGVVMDHLFTEIQGSQVVAKDKSWIPISRELYTVIHTTHAGTGDPITVVRLVRRPTDLPFETFDDDKIRVDVQNSITNPAAVMEDICETYGGMTVDFSDAETKLADWHMDFYCDDVPTVLQLLVDLAYQARCALSWTGQDPKLIYQGANGGVTDEAVERAQILTDAEHVSTFAMERPDIDSVYSEVVVRWREPRHFAGDAIEQQYQLRDAVVEARVGRRTLEVDCWAYDSIACPRALAQYMLERHKHLYRMISTNVTLYGMALEPGDLIDITHPALPISPEPGQIVDMAHRPGQHPTSPDLVHLVVRQFNWPGCSGLSCQGHCETTSCETSCQTDWQPEGCWTCMTTCQSQCELVACVTAEESICTSNACQTSCQIGCMVSCQPSSMVIGCGHCETVSCETTNCETTSCQTVSCETTNCETTSCQTAAQ